MQNGTRGRGLLAQVRILLAGRAGPYIAVYGCLFPSVVLAFFVPDDILMRSSWAASFSDWIAALVPMVRKASAVSPFSEMVMFYFAVMWALSPFWFLVSFLVPEQRMWPLETMRGRKLFLAFAMPIFIPVSFYFLLAFPGVDRLDNLPGLVQLMLSSRLGLALLGVIGPCFVTGFAYRMYVWIKRIPKLYFNK